MFMRSIDSKTFQVALTYDILLIVILGGIGSVTGSVVGAFLVTAGRELLRFFDDPLTIAGVSVPLFRSGFRMVIFSILLMAVVLFYSRGIMGNHEFSWDGLFRLIRGIPGKFKRGRKKPLPQEGRHPLMNNMENSVKNVLHMESITMQFGGVVAVNGLTLDVNEHEIVASSGPTGQAKPLLSTVSQVFTSHLWFRIL